MKDIEQEITEIVHVLPAEEQAKVLEFAENLKKETETTNGAETEDEKENARIKSLMQLKGIGRSGRSDTSRRVDEILAEGANKHEGWSLP